MQALVCHAFAPIDQLKVESMPAPVPSPTQVLIDVHAASINYPDTLMVQGLYQVKPPLPFVPGAELAGVVAAVGSEVRHVKPGDRVVASTGTGAFAQQCVAEGARTSALPAAMGFEEGASFVLAYGTSLHALQTVARLCAGETLLVLGAAGGVGIAAIQIAKALGGIVIAAASSPAKLALAREAGADHLVDYSDANWRKAVEAIVGDKGVDVVYDPVGGAYSETALRVTGWRGRYLVVGFAAGDIPKLPLNLMLLKERVVQGVFWGAAMQRDPVQHRANMTLLADWFANGRIKPPVTERVPLAEAAAAMHRLATRQAMGKVVVLPQG
jgi:NADPH2:quinone reductase